jgi:isoleucyl-tRNA synthetase
MDKDFMESVWWAFKTLYEKGLIYEGEKVLMYDTKFATPVSKAEVTMDNDAYQTVTDPSVFVKFRLEGEERFLLAWTTTPWTLPANMALAVNAKMRYVEVAVGGERLILAKDLAGKVLVDGKRQLLEYEVVGEMSGEELVGLQYAPLFPEVGASVVSEKAHRVFAADFVENEGGTGVVHIAPAYGEDDFRLAQKEGVPVRHAIDDNGYYLAEFAEALHGVGVKDTDEGGIEVWAANKFIAKCLAEAGVVWKIDYIQHEYPFNPRSKQRIMYRAIPSWFFDVEGQKPLMIAQNEKINWFPAHLKQGRFKKNIEQAPDWALSRNRFWATAMPVWKGDKGSVLVMGSYAELEKYAGVKLEDYHRPWVDEVEFEVKGEHFKRIEEVLDCWFESGSMPFAQMHYPFENKEKFEKNYPADFIVEYVGQVRAWFYYVHAINTALFGENAFKNVITTGTVAGNDGRKMSKSLGNFTDPNELMDRFSADALRFLLLSSPLLSGEDFALIDKDVSDVARKLAMIWNMYDFFTMYAEVDGWEFTGELAEPTGLKNPLDIWVIARLNLVTAQVEKYMEVYNIPDAMSGILPFVDDASNWFVRRSRRRFWKSEDDADKGEAYRTLHYVLARLALVLAPFTPFLAEELWQKMVDERGSVHLEDFPVAGAVDEGVLADMARTREIIEKGLALRMEREDGFGQIKVRQPLAELRYAGERLAEFYEGIIAEEVNVKTVGVGKAVWLDKELTEGLKQEGFVRELVRFVQNARKKAGLNVDDRIRLGILDYDLGGLSEGLVGILQAETLAVEVGAGNYGYDEVVAVEGVNITISLERV